MGPLELLRVIPSSALNIAGGALLVIGIGLMLLTLRRVRRRRSDAELDGTVTPAAGTAAGEAPAAAVPPVPLETAARAAPAVSADLAEQIARTLERANSLSDGEDRAGRAALARTRDEALAAVERLLREIGQKRGATCELRDACDAMLSELDQAEAMLRESVGAPWPTPSAGPAAASGPGELSEQEAALTSPAVTRPLPGWRERAQAR